MKIKNFIVLLGILSIFVLVGCAQQQTKYVCPDGSMVSEASLCPTRNAKLSNFGNTGVPHSCIDEAGTHTLLDECLSEKEGIHRTFYTSSSDPTVCQTRINTFECDPYEQGNENCFFDGMDAWCRPK